MMRLLYVCSDFGIAPNGTKGASIHLRAITRALADLGHEVLLLSPKAQPMDDHPARMLQPGGCSLVGKVSKPLKQWLVGRGFSDGAARELRPLLYNMCVEDQALDARSELGSALVDDPPDAIIERLSLFGHVGTDLADALHVPLIVEVNAPLAEEASKFRSLQMKALATEIEDRVLARADAIVAVSTPLADRLVTRGVHAKKTHVVPNGVDLQLFTNLPSRASSRDGLDLTEGCVVGFVGSLKVWHGVEVLVDAFAELHRQDDSTRLLIVGSGPAEAALRDRAARAGLNGSVVFTGAVPHEDVPRLIRAMDVTVAPFHSVPDFYFSPIKLFEYMAAGTCVVASDLGQIAEVIRDGVNGLLCPPNDVEALVAAFKKAKQSTDLRERLATQARLDVRNHHTWAQAARITTRIVEEAVLCNARGRSRVRQSTDNCGQTAEVSS